jgi:hypothetical protein
MYAKLFASLYQGTLRGKPDEILVFTNLLAHTTRDGVVDKHFRAIAEETGLTIEAVKAAIEVLESPDPESRSPEADGARIVRIDEHRVWGWRVVNHGKYRAIKNEEDRAEQNRLAQQRYRERQNGSAISKNAYSKQSKPRVSNDKPDKPMQSQMHKAESDAETKAQAISKSRGSRLEIDEFFRSIDLSPRDAEYMWNNWESNGWTIKGKAMKDWRATVRAWKAAGHMPSQKAPSASDTWPIERGPDLDKLTPQQRMEHYRKCYPESDWPYIMEDGSLDLMAKMMNRRAEDDAKRHATEGEPGLW